MRIKEVLFATHGKFYNYEEQYNLNGFTIFKPAFDSTLQLRMKLGLADNYPELPKQWKEYRFISIIKLFTNEYILFTMNEEEYLVIISYDKDIKNKHEKNKELLNELPINWYIKYLKLEEYNEN